MASSSQSPWRIVHSEASLGWGGQEHRVLAELAGFQKRGSDVWLLAPRQSDIYQRAGAAGVPAIHFETGRSRFFFEVVRLADWLRKKRIQVLNTHSSRDGWLLGAAGRLARVPLLLRTRHIDVDYPNPRVSRHAFTTCADHVLTTSNKITRHFQNVFHLPDSHITTLPTGIDLNTFSPSGDSVLLPGRAEGRPVVGMISVLRSWKGHATFLESATRLCGAGFVGQFVIAGEGPMRPIIEKQIRERQLENRVALLGHCENVATVLRALSVLVIASTKHEGIPQIGLQALACQTPVVGSEVGGIPEIIQAGITGRIVPAANPEALAVAIRATLSEQEFTRQMCRQGRQLVEVRYSREGMLDQLDMIYRRYVAGQQ